mmetsp:Transcript_34309/g.53518  ORF Transcript_34309/g.53518 Transcript_34309/m.53518 type:complete len:288 (+) Transcript_34309:3214-4077(+)
MESIRIKSPFVGRARLLAEVPKLELITSGEDGGASAALNLDYSDHRPLVHRGEERTAHHWLHIFRISRSCSSMKSLVSHLIQDRLRGDIEHDALAQTFLKDHLTSHRDRLLKNFAMELHQASEPRVCPLIPQEDPAALRLQCKTSPLNGHEGEREKIFLMMHCSRDLEHISVILKCHLLDLVAHTILKSSANRKRNNRGKTFIINRKSFILVSRHLKDSNSLFKVAWRSDRSQEHRRARIINMTRLNVVNSLEKTMITRRVAEIKDFALSCALAHQPALHPKLFSFS